MKKAQLVILISIGLLVASIGNGAVSYLKRIGLLERQAYENFMATYCELPRGSADGFGSRCTCMRAPANAKQPNTSKPAAAEPTGREYLYQNTGYERWLKLGKDALFGGFMLLSLYLIRTRRARLPELADAWPPMLLAVNVGIGLVISLALWGGSFALLGLRSFEFLAIVLLGGWAVGGMHHFARCIGWLLIIQAALVAVEVIFGIPLSSCPHWFRAAGTMVLPNSLGIVTVVALAFHSSFSPRKTYFPILLLATVAILVASGSGTGLVALFALLGMLALRRMTGSGKRVAGAVLLLLGTVMIVELPTLTHRPDIYDSLFAAGGRADTFKDVLRVTSATDTLIGRGVGFGTNTASNLAGLSPATPPAVVGTAKPFYADSTVTVLLTQLGIIGVAAFYWMLGWAFWRDPIARPTYLVIGLASLTMNITELFPVNFLLGLVLAHTIAVSGLRRAKA